MTIQVLHDHDKTVDAMMACKICRKRYHTKQAKKPGRSRARKRPPTTEEARAAALKRWYP